MGKLSYAACDGGVAVTPSAVLASASRPLESNGRKESQISCGLIASVNVGAQCHDGGVPTSPAKVVCTEFPLNRTLARVHTALICGPI
jgi:hypothetical protein